LALFGYHYDGLNRQIAKHILGAGWRFSVLDKQDREVFLADESDKSKGYWQFRKVDALGLVVASATTYNFVKRPGSGRSIRYDL
jgi:hypothetical protein